MKFRIIFILLSISIYCSCLDKSRIKKFKQQLLTVPDNLDSFLVYSYPEAILLEINQYLTLYQKPQLVLSDELTKTSKLAAEEILSHNSFGQHSQIEQWQTQVPNDIFTEMCFNVNVTNSNYYSKALSSKTQKIMYDTKMSVGTVMKTPNAPTAQMFAKNIMESLEAEHLLLSLDQYTHCGISINEMDQTKYPNEYLAVIHLIKQGSEPTAKAVFTSCKDALKAGNTDESITITVNGIEKQVKCNQKEQQGGWTLIHTENKDYFNANATVPIDDLDLQYTEIFIKTGESHYLDFAYNEDGIWLSYGFNFALNMFQFGDYWYISEELPTSFNRQSFLASINNLKKYKISDLIQQITPSTKCQFENQNIDYLDMCSRAFIFKKQEGKFNAISDDESLTSQTGNNKLHYEFQVFVR